MINHPYPLIEVHKDKTLLWYSSDNPKNYRYLNANGKNIYFNQRIEYKLNNYGFRCDNFYNCTDIPVIFMGCSNTFGVGVHYTETWAYKVYNSIKKKYNIEFPYWNIGIPNTGIDTHAACLYWLLNFSKPNLIIGYIPPFFRREYRYESDIEHTWNPENSKNKNLDIIFSDKEFYLHQSRRSLTILDLSSRISNSRCYISLWSNDECEVSLVKEFKHLNYVEAPESYSVDLARDSMHPGPQSHTEIANRFLDSLNLVPG